MRGNITVNEAIDKGRIKLVYLPLITVFCTIGLAFYFGIERQNGIWILPVGFLAGIVLAWLIWSYFVTDWKIWAFQNVQNVHELERKAIEARLIYKRGSWYEKTEFKSEIQKQELKLLEKKFLQEDVYFDDISVPKERLVIYSQSNATWSLLIGVGLLITGFYLYDDISGLIWLFPIVIGIISLYQGIKKSFDKSVKIQLNDKGIKLKDKELVDWDRIYNDKVYTKKSGKSTTTYLSFNNEEVEIDDLNINFVELENLLHVYRVRYERNKSI